LFVLHCIRKSNVSGFSQLLSNPPTIRSAGNLSGAATSKQKPRSYNTALTVCSRVQTCAPPPPPHNQRAAAPTSTPVRTTI
jgi:hypothetical protein